MAEWLKGCEICDAALVSEVDKFREIGMNENKACKEVHKQQFNLLGNELYSVENIKYRYRYHKGMIKRCEKHTFDEIEKLSKILRSAARQVPRAIEHDGFMEYKKILVGEANKLMIALMEGKKNG